MIRLGWLIGIVGFGLVAFFTSAHAQERVPVPGGAYDGTLTDTTGECSRGTITVGPAFTLIISEYGYRVESIQVTDLTYPPFFTTPTSYSLSLNFPVAADGTFSQDYSPISPVNVHFDGRFAGRGVTGSFRVDLGGTVECQGTYTAQLRPNDRVEHRFEGQIPLVDGCGGGTYSITRSIDLLSIVRTSVEGFQANGHTFSGSGTFPEGTVPIDPQTGSFDWVYFPGREAGQEIALSGNLEQGGGLIVVSPSTCGPISLSGGSQSFGRGNDVSFGALPNSGSGPSQQGGLPAWWWLLLGGSGLGVASGALVARRRGAGS